MNEIQFLSSWPGGECGFVFFGPPGLSPLNALKFIYILPKRFNKEHNISTVLRKAGTITFFYIDHYMGGSWRMGHINLSPRDTIPAPKWVMVGVECR